MVNPGDACPDFKLEAAVSGRAISPSDFAGTKAVLVFHGPRTTQAPKDIGKAVRAEHPSADDLLVANVINMKSMGGLWKKVANAQVNQTYERMAEKLEANGSDPAAFVVLCPDWDNAVAPSFGIEDSNTEAAAVVVDADGVVVGAATGDDLPGQILTLLN